MLQFVAMTVSEGEWYLYFETQYPDSLIDMAVSFKPDLTKSQKMTKNDRNEYNHTINNNLSACI